MVDIPKYSVRTYVDFDTRNIKTEVWYERIDHHMVIASRMMETEELAVKNALVALGWTPPPEDWQRPKDTDAPVGRLGTLRDASLPPGGTKKTVAIMYAEQPEPGAPWTVVRVANHELPDEVRRILEDNL